MRTSLHREQFWPALMAAGLRIAYALLALP
jgi:hypothetical protein